MVGDWYHVRGDEYELVNHRGSVREKRGSGENVYLDRKYRAYSHDGISIAATAWHAGLINGRGRYGGKNYPLSKFQVQRGQTYLFRAINVGAEYLLKISIDNHLLRVVATDGFDLEPFDVSYIIVSPGERVDFEVVANQIEGRYWLRAETLNDYTQYKTYDGRIHDVKAIFVYEHISDDIDPTSEPTPCYKQSKCFVFNCPFGYFPESYNRTCINMEHVNSTMTASQLTERYGVGNKDIHEVFMNVGFSGGSSISSRKFVMPQAPLFQENPGIVECSEVCTDPSSPCACTNQIKIPLNKTIQIIISNIQPVPFANHHPMHIHGNSFAVIHIGYATSDPLTGKWTDINRDVECSDHPRRCKEPVWNGSSPVFPKTKPGVKDTITVPAHGYVVLRMKSSNPGFWLVHCHMSHHRIGMALLLHVGEGYYPPPPPGFPSCNNFSYSAAQFAEQMVKTRQFLGLGSMAGRTTTDTPSITPTPTSISLEKEICAPKG